MVIYFDWTKEGWTAAFPEEVVIVDGNVAILNWKMFCKNLLGWRFPKVKNLSMSTTICQYHKIIVTIMHSIAAAVFSSLLLLKKVNVQTIVFMTESENVCDCNILLLNKLLLKQAYPCRCTTGEPISSISTTPGWNKFPDS